MKIRIMGTAQECNIARRYYSSLRTDSNINYVEISELYPNRGSSTLYRIYVDISYRDSYFEQASGATGGGDIVCQK